MCDCKSNGMPTLPTYSYSKTDYMLNTDLILSKHIYGARMVLFNIP